MKTLYTSLTTLLVLAGSSGAIAGNAFDQGVSDEKEYFAAIDDNNNGKWSRAEALDAGLTEVSFSNADIDDNGKIDREEYDHFVGNPYNEI